MYPDSPSSPLHCGACFPRYLIWTGPPNHSKVLQLVTRHYSLVTVNEALQISAKASRIGLDMLSEEDLRRLLLPFGLDLSSAQLASLQTYLNLLLRWNRRINLTALREPEECVTRLFGESLYLARWIELRGQLLDVGSGAGFPGLALKIAFPTLAITLLEPVAKKRAFLKEVARACQWEGVEVLGERVEAFARSQQAPNWAATTSRALGHYETLVPSMLRCLKPQGSLFLWVTRKQGNDLGKMGGAVEWQSPLRIPLTDQGEIWHGIKKTTHQRS